MTFRYSKIAFLLLLGSSNAREVARLRNSADQRKNIRVSNKVEVDEYAAREEIDQWDRFLMSSSFSMNPAPAPAPSPTPDKCGLTNKERRKQLFEIISDVSTPAALTTPGTPQNQAFEWLVNDDKFRVCPEEPVCNNKAINRYVAALLYYSTEGDEWVNCNAQTSPTPAPCNPNGVKWSGGMSQPCFAGKAERWLSASDECLWCGLSCKDEEELGKAFGIPAQDPPGCYLTDIDLEMLNQSGVIPFELQSAPELLTIRMEDGAISGTMPPQLSKLQKLAVLDLNFQNLSGPIPDSYYDFNFLIQLDLNDNQFTGTLSPDIGNLPFMLFLDVGNNRLEGLVPEGLSKLNFIVGLGLYGNEFTGPMPRLNSTELETVYVYENQLTGTVDFIEPRESLITGVINLKEFDARDNFFTGEIPASFGNAKLLEFASFSENELTGVMPPEICANRNNTTPPGNLKFLESDCDEPSPAVECSCCTFCT